MRFLVMFLFVISLCCHICPTNCEVISFKKYLLSTTKVYNANVIRAKPNCGPSTVQIIPGDCRPVYSKVNNERIIKETVILITYYRHYYKFNDNFIASMQ